MTVENYQNLSLAWERERLGSGQMTTAVVAEYLRDGRFALRTFSELLKDLYPEADLQARLTNAFVQDDPDANSATIAKVVRNWLSGKARPAAREDIFHIAFALGLSEPQANLLLGHCTDCSSPDRMCHATVILDRKPNSHPMEILLVAESLGY